MSSLLQLERKYDKMYRCCLLLLIGLCMFVMFGTGGNYKNFFHDGAAYRGIKILDFISLTNAETAQNSNVLGDAEVYHEIPADDIDGIWRYLQVDLKNMSVPEIAVQILITDKEQEILYDGIHQMSQGENTIDLGKMQNVSLKIVFVGDIGTELALDGIYLWESFAEWNLWNAISGAVIMTLVLAFVFRKLSLYQYAGTVINVICRFYGKILKKVEERMLPEMYRHPIRIFLYFFIIIYLTLSVNIGWRDYDTIVFFVIFILLGFLTSEKQKENIIWNTSVARHWVLTCIWMMISDFLVSKTVMWTGYLWLFGFGFFIYAWSGKKDKNVMIDEFKTALQISYICMFVFCILCRPDNTERYMGPFRNPNMFGFYLIIVLCVCLSGLNKFVFRKTSHYIVYIAELISVFFWTWKTQARTAMLAIALVIFLWILEKCFKLKRKKWRWQRMKMALAVLVLSLPIWYGMEWGISNIPDRLGTGIIMERDLFLPLLEQIISVDTENIFYDVVYAGESTVLNRTNSETINAISSGRLGIWSDFLKEWNLLGHRGNAGNYSYGAHNLLIGIAYRYGVLVLVPYVFMWLSVLWSAWKNMLNKKGTHGFFLLAMLLSYCWMAALNDIERSCSYLIWVCAYMFIGFFFYDDTAEQTFT